MGAGVLKSHHPCFLVYFERGCADGGFQPHDGLFCPLRSGDIFFAPCDGFKLCRVAAFITTICLSSPTASADAKLKIAPSTVNAKQ
jgi:hypothetical protein